MSVCLFTDGSSSNSDSGPESPGAPASSVGGASHHGSLSSLTGSEVRVAYSVCSEETHTAGANDAIHRSKSGLPISHSNVKEPMCEHGQTI